MERNNLTYNEKENLITSVKKVFTGLKKVHELSDPIYIKEGFKPPSFAVIARDISEKIESSIIDNCQCFEIGKGYNDLNKSGERWEVKVSKHPKYLTINQSSVVNGENYFCVNYNNGFVIKRIFILWNAQDHFFSERVRNRNSRTLKMKDSIDNIEIIYKS